MVKSELIEHLSQHADITILKSESIVDAFFQVITDAIAKRSRVEIRGFGAFTVKEYKAYEGRNPKTGTTVKVPEKSLPVWRTGTELRQRVDSPLRS